MEMEIIVNLKLLLYDGTNAWCALNHVCWLCRRHVRLVSTRILLRVSWSCLRSRRAAAFVAPLLCNMAAMSMPTVIGRIDDEGWWGTAVRKPSLFPVKIKTVTFSTAGRRVPDSRDVSLASSSKPADGFFDAPLSLAVHCRPLLCDFRLAVSSNDNV